ncbi:CROWDED NUCLEI 4-like [Olea europaea subsp. europaea]|uniref:CROWDED NUCLEI 4-like n=1 Tax=Olea europaea subsp. europaea TaxID=158383 RepID=A0A8S0TUS6_OLEEU|nr:CROWDED NUCLEI 4-like [Olea europaea subsp. europaea]
MVFILQFGNAHVGDSIHGDHVNEVHSSYAKDLVHSPHSVSGRKNGLLYKCEPSFQVYDSMEGATKWDPVGWKTSDALKQVFGQHILNQRTNSAPVISALEVELEQARSRINELETERRSSKKKVEQFLQKLSEERTAWRSREHEKIRSVINDIKADLSREKKNRQRLEMVNSKLVNELNDVKLSAKRYMQDYEKERKSRELIEEVCDELARELGEYKADAEALKRQSMKLQEEVEEDRKMLQMAEVWREERVQMKLVDAKAMLEEKYSQMSRLIVDLETFMNSKSATSNVDEMKKAKFLQQAAASVNMLDIREIKYEPPNPDDILSAFEDVNLGATIEEEVNPCVSYSHSSHASKIHTVSPEVNVFNKDDAWRHSNAYFDQTGELEEDTSEWETVSHLDDQGSSFSPDRSDQRVDKNDQTPVSDVSEVCSLPTRHRKKVSSISRLWRSHPSNGDNHKIISIDGINGLSDHVSAKGLSPQDSVGQLSSPDLGNPNITQGMKGCIEWPRNAQKNSLKAKLLAARMESQKIQLRQVLKQKY